MCLAVPMRVEEVDNLVAICSARGIKRTVNLLMIHYETIQPGDYVLVHVGYAIQSVSEEEARAAWELYDEMFAAEEAQLKSQEPGHA